MFLTGDGIPDRDPRGRRVVDDSFHLVFNAHYEPMRFALPDGTWSAAWQEVIRTSVGVVDHGPVHRAGDAVDTDARELVVLQLVRPPDGIGS